MTQKSESASEKMTDSLLLFFMEPTSMAAWKLVADKATHWVDWHGVSVI